MKTLNAFVTDMFNALFEVKNPAITGIFPHITKDDKAEGFKIIDEFCTVVAEENHGTSTLLDSHDYYIMWQLLGLMSSEVHTAEQLDDMDISSAYILTGEYEIKTHHQFVEILGEMLDTREGDMKEFTGDSLVSAIGEIAVANMFYMLQEFIDEKHGVEWE